MWHSFRNTGYEIMAKARPSSAEIDRFLEEVNRRKQQQARKPAPPPPAVQQPPRPKPQQVQRQVRVQQKQVMIEEPVVNTVVIETLPEPPQDLPVRTAASAYQLPAAQPVRPRGSLSAPVQHALSLLRSRDGLRAMFVMNEILSPPRSVQPYGRKR